MNVLPDRCCICGSEIKDYHSTCHWKYDKEKRGKNYLEDCRVFSKWYKREYVR